MTGPAVRLGVLGRPARRARRRATSRPLGEAARGGRRSTRTTWPATYFAATPPARPSGPRYLRDNVGFRARRPRAGRAAAVLPRRGGTGLAAASASRVPVTSCADVRRAAGERVLKTMSRDCDDDRRTCARRSAPAAGSIRRRGARAVPRARRRTLLGQLADEVRARRHPDRIVTYIIDRNVNYTNVCVARCNFCAFYRPVGVGRRLRPRVRRDLPEDRRDDRARRRAAAAAGRPQPRPAARVVRGSVPRGEAALSRRSGCTRSRRRRSSTSRGSRSCRCPTSSTGSIAAGLDSIPGGGAEILVDRVRKLLQLLQQGDRRRVARRHAPRPPGGPAHDGDDDVRDGRDAGGAARAPVPAARPAGRDRRLHRVHRLELSARAHRAAAASRRPASTTCGRSRPRASCSTTSTTCRRRGSRRAARSGSSASRTARTTWAAS